jgi:hypothetical protein
MNKKFSIKPYQKKEPLLAINPKIAREIGLDRKKRAYVSFGVLKNYIDIEFDNEINEDAVLLSQTVIDNLRLPGHAAYEMRTRGNEIVIGPYIGMLVSDEDANITDARLKKFLIFVEEYEKLNGVFAVFALDKVDTANRLIEGYCYNPSGACWERGVFPYPSAIYRTIGMSESWRNHFLSVLGDKFFNDHFFNKWDMYRWFSTDTELRRYLPHTVLYRSQRDIWNMLQRYGRVIVKPVSGLKGRKIVRIGMENDRLVFQYRENGKNQRAVPDKPSDMNKFIEDRFNTGKYLVQQAIDLLENDGSIMDFRCALQKDQSNRWVCNAVIGRFGDKDSIVSNVSSGGTTYQGTDLLKKALHLPEKEIEEIKGRMEALAIKIASALDEFGINCGTLGLDIGLDTDGRLWLIEINNRDPSPQYALDINDRPLYGLIKTSPLFYAKALAGFDIKR